MKWFKLSLDEGLLIWKARNQAKHGEDQDTQAPWHEMVKQYHDALATLRKFGQKLPDKPVIRKANRAAMENCIEKANELRLSQSIIVHLHVDVNSLNFQQQRELQQRLNNRRTARAVSNGNTRISQQRQTQLRFRPPGSSSSN